MSIFEGMMLLEKAGNTDSLRVWRAGVWDTYYVFLVRFMNEKTYECSRRILDFEETCFFIREGRRSGLHKLPSMHPTKGKWSSYLLDCNRAEAHLCTQTLILSYIHTYIQESSLHQGIP